MKVKFTVTANYDFGGDEVGKFDTLAQATQATKAYVAQAEKDGDDDQIQSVVMMPTKNGSDVPSLAATWMFDGWSNSPTVSDIENEEI